MQINLPTDTDPIVLNKAAAAGFGEDVAAYVAHLIVMDEPATDPRGSLTDEQMQQSVTEIAAADAAIDAGQGIDLEVGFQQIAEKHGFKLQ